MKHFSRAARICLCLLALPGMGLADSNSGVHTTWLWHLHQPIYWPNRRDHGVDHYEQAWDTIQAQNAGRLDPSPEVLSTIFGEADRMNVYQGEIESVISGLLSYPNAGGLNIGTNGFFVVPGAALQDSLGNGTFDLLYPAREDSKSCRSVPKTPTAS